MNFLWIFLFGLTILLGTFFILFMKENKVVRELPISIAFSVLVFLILLELIPESLERLEYMHVVFFSLVGFILLKLLDFMIPEHQHSSTTSHVSHIGLMASIALILHNFIEGMALYTSLKLNIHVGLLMGLGVGLHNIPMGMIIGSTLQEAKYSKGKIIGISFLVSLSTLMGAFLISFFTVKESVLGALLSVTLGMIIYITFCELFEHLQHQDKKTNIIGFLIGAGIFLISLLFHSH